MANIVSYERVDVCNETSIKPVEVHCLYTTKTLDDGNKVLVIKTYNPNSKNAGNCRTLHFTKESAAQLINIFKSELGI